MDVDTVNLGSTMRDGPGWHPPLVEDRAGGKLDCGPLPRQAQDTLPAMEAFTGLSAAYAARFKDGTG